MSNVTQSSQWEPQKLAECFASDLQNWMKEGDREWIKKKINIKIAKFVIRTSVFHASSKLVTEEYKFIGLQVNAVSDIKSHKFKESVEKALQEAFSELIKNDNPPSHIAVNLKGSIGVMELVNSAFTFHSYEKYTSDNGSSLIAVKSLESLVNCKGPGAAWLEG